MAAAAARDECGAPGHALDEVAAGVAFLGRGHEVGALGEEVGQGERGTGSVPGRKGLAVERVPPRRMGGEGQRRKALLETGALVRVDGRGRAAGAALRGGGGHGDEAGGAVEGRRGAVRLSLPSRYRSAIEKEAEGRDSDVWSRSCNHVQRWGDEAPMERNRNRQDRRREDEARGKGKQESGADGREAAAATVAGGSKVVVGLPFAAARPEWGSRSAARATRRADGAIRVDAVLS